MEASVVSKRQVFDVPAFHFVTTEHQAETVPYPGCGGVTSGIFPPEVTQLVQYGSQVKHLTVYLLHEQFIRYEQERQMLADLFAFPLCQY